MVIKILSLKILTNKLVPTIFNNYKYTKKKKWIKLKKIVKYKKKKLNYYIHVCVCVYILK